MRLLSLVLLFGIGASAVAAPPTGNYKTVVDRLTALQAQYSKISSIFSIGTNDEGTEIYAIRVSANPTVMDPSKIGHVVVSTHHGNEAGAPQFTLAFIADLLQRFSSDELWRGNLADQEFSIIPVLNITGYNKNQRHEYNQDPNRAYEGPCSSPSGKGLKSIQRLVDFLTTRTFAASVTVHGYDGSLTYPWGVFTTNTHTKDHNYYGSLFEKAAEFNGYRTGTAADVVYPANGCYEDYVYWKYGMWSLLLELRDGSTQDIRDTVKAISSFYSEVNASPSVQNQMTGSCNRGDLPDLRIE